jgi:hypothetical protein
MGSKWFLVTNGAEGKNYGGIGAGTIAFSADSQHLAYAAQVDSKWVFVWDGQEGKQYDGVAKDLVTFSSDGQHLAYAAQTYGQWRVILDGDEGGQYSAIMSGSPGYEVGRIIWDSNTSLHYLAGKGNEVYLVKDQPK